MTRRWTEIVIHHSAGRGRTSAHWEGIRRDHVERRGWLDIGYHWGIGYEDERPVLLVGRPERMIGSHCPGHNTSAIGLCFLGNFTAAEPEPETLTFGAAILVSLCLRHEITVRSIHPHRAFRATTCPGNAFPFDRLVELVTAELAEL